MNLQESNGGKGETLTSKLDHTADHYVALLIWTSQSRTYLTLCCHARRPVPRRPASVSADSHDSSTSILQLQRTKATLTFQKDCSQDTRWRFKSRYLVLSLSKPPFHPNSTQAQNRTSSNLHEHHPHRPLFTALLRSSYRNMGTCPVAESVQEGIPIWQKNRYQTRTTQVLGRPWNPFCTPP